MGRKTTVIRLSVPEPAVGMLATLEADEHMASHHRLEAVRAHLLEKAGDTAARASYQRAARRTTSRPEQRYLEARAARLLAEAPHDANRAQ